MHLCNTHWRGKPNKHAPVCCVAERARSVLLALNTEENNKNWGAMMGLPLLGMGGVVDP